MKKLLVADLLCGAGAIPEAHRCHRFKHGLSYTAEYRAWQQMRLRCTDPEHAAYANYGGRGIQVCAQWLDSPARFLADMGPKPSPAHELDRIDNDGNYEPGNCRWATRSENDRNRRSNRFVTHGGETLTLAEWCDRFGLPDDVLRWRLGQKWPVEKALTTPIRARSDNRPLIRAAMADAAQPAKPAAARKVAAA